MFRQTLVYILNLYFVLMKYSVPIAIGVVVILVASAGAALLLMNTEEEELREHTLDADDVEYEITGGDTLAIKEYLGNDCRNLTIDGVEINGKVYTVEKIEKGAFSFRKGLKGTLTLGDGLKEICESSFNRTGFTKIVLPDSLESIGKLAFANSKISTKVEISENLTDIGAGAFSGSRVIGFVVDENNTKYSSLSGSLYNKDKTEIVAVTNGIVFNFGQLPSTVTKIGPYCFYNYDCQINEATIDLSNVTVFSECCFCNSKMSGKLILSDSITEIGRSAFNTCKMYGDVTIPSTVESIGDYAFMNFMGFLDKKNPGTDYSLTIKTGVKSIGDEAFKCSKFSGKLLIPKGLTEIGDGAFYGCEYLTSITFDKDVSSIGSYAFYGCLGLKNGTVTFLETTAPTLGDYSFSLNRVYLSEDATKMPVTFYGNSWVSSTTFTDKIIGYATQIYFDHPYVINR